MWLMTVFQDQPSFLLGLVETCRLHDCNHPKSRGFAVLVLMLNSLVIFAAEKYGTSVSSVSCSVYSKVN